jgi:uncharacterized protein YpiB (UPF0302 family)
VCLSEEMCAGQTDVHPSVHKRTYTNAPSRERKDTTTSLDSVQMEVQSVREPQCHYTDTDEFRRRAVTMSYFQVHAFHTNITAMQAKLHSAMMKFADGNLEKDACQILAYQALHKFFENLDLSFP